ncbi:unnamed protein product [Rotaria socialis]|uniref:Uncharacterized protein n=1 Tax=Rotaria socialis TaxID=392032 RepID=A0A820UV83_9BILA|nr:unnamed protein product [Rotaria socialis]
MVFFQSLKILKIIASSEYDYPSLVIWNHQSTTCFSSTLTVLCITVFGFDHCLLLLDGRLKQLTTFKVQVHAVSRSMLIDCNKDDLINLKCFSLTNYNYTYEYEYDDLVVPLLRRMTYLEKLTLCLRIQKVGRFVSGASLSIDDAHLHNEILVHMPQLHTFKFYISTETNAIYSNLRFSNDDIQQTFINMKYGQTACIMDYYGACGTLCHVYSLPFTFTHLHKITTHFPFIVFDTVTNLFVYDIFPFEHEFFMRINQTFPLLKCFTIENDRREHWNYDDNPSYSIIESTHLTSLEITHAGQYYVEQFLVKTNTLLPRLTRLKVEYNDLKTIATNFTREETRHNCSKVKQLIVEELIVFSKYVYQYFPSL